MKDGETYEVGVSEAAGVRGWMEGTLGELLEMRKAGRKPEVREEVIRYVVEEGARFEVRRPDEDGELDWP